MKWGDTVKVFVLRKLDVKECHADICGVYSAEGKQKALASFVQKQKEMNEQQAQDIEINIAAQKKERADLTSIDNELLVRAGSKLNMAETRLHEHYMQQIEDLTQSISTLNAHKNNILHASDEQLAADYMEGYNLTFKEFELQ